MSVRRLRSWRVLAATATVAWTIVSAGATEARTYSSPAPTNAKPCVVRGVDTPLDAVWRPHMLAAIGYTDTRTGDVAFAVRTEDRFYGYRPDHVEWSASVVKAMLMVAYLDEPWVQGRDLNGHDRSLLTPMITESDNDAAQRVFDTVGQFALRALAKRVGMTHFATSPIWGETQITAADQTRFFLHIDRYVAARHRAYAMSLLAGIVPVAALGGRRGRAQGVAALLQGRLGLRHRAARPPGRAPRPRLRARLDRGADHARRIARLRQGHAQGHLHPSPARASDRQSTYERLR